jgi:uncharacterized protein YbjT (DUF2867 family)
MKTAIVFGATGLVGSAVVRQLQSDPRYAKIHLFVRREAGFSGEKIVQHLVDMAVPENWASDIVADEVYCCVGTTIKQAGSQEAFRAVDYAIPVRLAEISAKNGVAKLLVVSAMGAEMKSSVFYNRVKGEMERDVQQIAQHTNLAVRIVQPSLLLGNRAEYRFGERVAATLMRAFDFMIPAQYKAIHVETVARAMVRLANEDALREVFTSDSLLILGK